jgi:adenosylcobinamide-GDP ribazoletransferase
MRAIITAIRTLTLLPVPGRDTNNFASAIPFFPAVGALIGSIVVAVLCGIAHTGWMAGAGALAAITAILITRGLHIDGLADVADALGVRGSTERRLAVMKDPHTGAFGAIAIAADLLLKTVALTQIAHSGHWALAIAPFIASRAAQAVVTVTLPYARAEGGTAAGFVRGARPLHLILAITIASACSFATGGLASMVLLVQGLVLAVLLRAWMKHTFGGVTGDLIGTTNEVVETGLLVFVAASLTLP